MPLAATKKEVTERLKKLSADFELFAHITSHDLRDPLRQARIDSSELLAKLNKEQRDELESINHSIDEVLHKIGILRDFSFAANDKEKHAAIDLNKVLEGVLAEFSEKLKAINAEVKVGKMPKVTGHERHLYRLFSYLLDNAIQFRKPDKKLKITIEASKKGNFWQFTVADNGIGLEEVYRELVFVLFQRLDTSEENSNYGTGLAFARKIIEGHGGKIWYKSDGRSGTTFYFTIKK